MNESGPYLAYTSLRRQSSTCSISPISRSENMYTFYIAVASLVIGFMVYSKVVEHVFHPDDRKTPALELTDGVDYVTVKPRRAFLIQLLNIAGTGPIFGAIMGAMWGPVVFIWIVAGTILGGAVHDYMCGMISMRNNGRSVTELIAKYLGAPLRLIVTVFTLVTLIMVAVVFTNSSAQLLETLTDVNIWFWIAMIFGYFIVAAMLPIDKFIGRFYPIFGILLVVMAVGIVLGLIVGGYSFPDVSFTNQHPEGTPIWPFMFITVACGAISGFHATQAPLISRCLRSEKEGRNVFYGAMVAEGLIALVWVAAGMAYFGSTDLLYQTISVEGVSSAVYEISYGTMGALGGFLAVLGVIICPVSSSDTALRSARLIISDYFKIEQKALAKRGAIMAAFLIVCTVLMFVDFTILWRYFTWFNQTLAMIVLWTASAYLVINSRNRLYPLITALPAAFMSAVTCTYILTASEGLGLPYGLSSVLGSLFAASCFAYFLYRSKILTYLSADLSPDN